MTNTAPYGQYPQQQVGYTPQPQQIPQTQPSWASNPPQATGTPGKLYMGLLLTGLIIFFVAGIIRSLTFYEDLIDEDHLQNIYATVYLLMNIGILISAIGLALGGFRAENLSERVRSTMLVAAGSCFVAGAIVNIFFYLP